MSNWNPPGRMWQLEDPPMVIELNQKVRELEAELATLKENQRQRENAAYENGLGSAAEVLRQNRILCVTLAALTDPSHRLNLRSP